MRERRAKRTDRAFLLKHGRASAASESEEPKVTSVPKSRAGVGFLPSLEREGCLSSEARGILKGSLERDPLSRGPGTASLESGFQGRSPWREVRRAAPSGGFVDKVLIC